MVEGKYAKLIQKSTGREFGLDGNTVIGRGSISEWELYQKWAERLAGDHANPGVRKASLWERVVGWLEGKEPLSLESLKSAYGRRSLELLLEDPDSTISRRHLLFCLPTQRVKNYSVIDLFSLSGTEVNGEYLEPAVPRAIQHGDVIGLNVEKGMEYFIFKETRKVTRYEGVIVANPDGTLQEDNPVGDALKGLLELRGFKIDLLKESVKRREMYRALEERAANLSSDDMLLFLYFGHGSQNGELRFKNGNVAVGDLYRVMENIRARKVMIFDCCFGGYYLRNIPLNSAVAVSTKRFDVAYANTFSRGLVEALGQDVRGKYLGDLVKDVCHRVEFDLKIRGMDPGVQARSVVYFSTVPIADAKDAREIYDTFMFDNRYNKRDGSEEKAEVTGEFKL